MVEQNCVYLDADDKDQEAWHLLGTDQTGQLLAHCRIVPKGSSYPEYVSLGRVDNSSKARKMGLGRELIFQALGYCENLFGKTPVKIGAQTYLLRFYDAFGFRSVGEEYLEDGIPHISMIKEW